MKQFGLNLRWNSHSGIADGEVQHRPRVFSRLAPGWLQADGQHHFPLLGELHRIPHQVQQYLAQTQRIAYQFERHLGLEAES